MKYIIKSVELFELDNELKPETKYGEAERKT